MDGVPAHSRVCHLDPQACWFAAKQDLPGPALRRPPHTAESLCALELIENPGPVAVQKRGQISAAAVSGLHDLDATRTHPKAELPRNLRADHSVLDATAVNPNLVWGRCLHRFSPLRQLWRVHSRRT